MDEFQNLWDKAINACYYCGKEASSDVKLRRCGRCKCALYCSVTCQKKAWSQGHKDECQDIATEKSLGTWSPMTGKVPMLPKDHRLWKEPTPEGGLTIAQDCLAIDVSMLDVYRRNPLLGTWMSRLIMLDQSQLDLVAEFLQGNCKLSLMPKKLLKNYERRELIRSIFLVGCGMCGQPTIAEIVKVKFCRHKLQKWKEMKECTFLEIDKDTGGSATFLCKRSKSTTTCAMGVIAKRLNLFQDPAMMTKIGNFDDLYLFSDKNAPTTVVDVDTVKRDLCQVLEALDIPTEAGIDAIMAATSIRVLSEQLRIPQEYHLKRKYLGVQCRWP